MVVSDPIAALQRYWGYQSFRPFQREAVDAALARRDCLVVLPTGAGKSLCYQVPAAAGCGLVVVVSPLIALMDDQVAAAQAAGLRAGALHSQRDDDERRDLMGAAQSGQLDLLYVSPERLAVGDVLARCADRVGLVAVDEAHCVSHWGHDFRPEYRQLAECFQAVPVSVPRMALTATATAAVRDDIAERLGLRDPIRLVGHPDRPNLVYRALPRGEVVAQILEVAMRHPGEGGIVYALSRKEVEKVAAQLRSKGLDAAAYHAGLDGDERRRVQAAFVAESLQVVVATVAFGMGIDRSNVRWVVHAGSPRSIEHYQQESGRAGRDGLPADCVLLFGAGDLGFHRFLMNRDAPPPERLAAMEDQLRSMARFATAPICRHRLLSEHFAAPWPVGEPSDAADGCGACDCCLGETAALADEEALLVAQKIISAVWRTGGRFGASHIAAVLRGADTAPVRRHGHQDLSVYGILQGANDKSIRTWIDQLIAQDLLAQERVDGFSLVGLTESGKALCKGQGSVRLSQPVTRTSNRGAGRRGHDVDAEAWEGVDRDLFAALRTVRATIAKREGVPPYVVFHDRSLRDFARRKPTQEWELTDVSGVGEAKAARYGGAMLEAIRAHAAPG